MISPDRLSRIQVSLDGSVPLERLILKRLGALPVRARQTWIRSLLTQGFLIECRALRLMREDTRSSKDPRIGAPVCIPPAAPYASAAAFPSTGNEKRQTPVPAASAESAVRVSTTEKPFAHLRRVIG